LTLQTRLREDSAGNFGSAPRAAFQKKRAEAFRISVAPAGSLMFHRPSSKTISCVLTVVCFAGSLLAYGAEQTGVVRSGNTPIRFASVALYSAGNSQSSAPVLLGNSQTKANGSFSIAFTPPSNPNAILYLVADGGILASSSSANTPASSAIRLATVLGAAAIPAGVVINERTTVATAYSMAQFISGWSIAGSSPGLQNAAATMFNLVNPATGGIATVLGSAPNGPRTSTMREFNSLANLLASCVDAVTAAPCERLFVLATPTGSAAPQDTLQAAVNIAHNPWLNPAQLFLRSLTQTQYRPALLLAPDAWTLAIVYEGNGHEFDGPGQMSIDADGDVWSTINYTYAKSPLTCAVGGRIVSKLTPTGLDAPGAPYSGGGLYGAGFGIALDPWGNLWVSNFGFQGMDNGVPCDPNPPAFSVSKFSANGTPLSPPKGFMQGMIDQPQGTASDQQGNVWIANCGNNSVAKFPGGNPIRAVNFHDVGLGRPFGLAIDGWGNAWVSNNKLDSVVGLTPNGKVITGSAIAVGQAPLGDAVDSLGNVWVANSGVVGVPCGDFKGGLAPPSSLPSITEVVRSGNGASATTFTGGGLTVPWGVAVDGDDNIWIANFAGRRVSEFCGARPKNCPAGDQTGDAISPRGGYSSDALTRNTGIAIDPSGNVWVANNWLTVSVQTNPGGRGLVVFIGASAPIQTPLIGPPHRP
jgi:sugar lactone lactonase YvrE